MSRHPCRVKYFYKLNERVLIYMEDKFSKFQFGYRFKTKTTDSLFVLRTLRNKYIHLGKRQMYTCFIDWRKALFKKKMVVKFAKVAIST